MALNNFTADCSEQYINVYNGMASSWPLIGMFCKDNLPPPQILGQSGQMYIEYHGSSRVPANSGFSINSTLLKKGKNTAAQNFRIKYFVKLKYQFFF